jgi:integrase
VIPPEDVKNDQPLEYPLPKVVNEMLGLYDAVFRPRLCRSDSPWLFPGKFGGYKTKGTLSGQIIKTIMKELGIRVTPHQFRHLAAAFILEKDPATTPDRHAYGRFAGTRSPASALAPCGNRPIWRP